MLERDVERKLVARIRKLGGIAYKFTARSRRSVPDRCVLLPGGRVVFVELKAPGKRPTIAQAREIEKIRGLGFEVLVIDSMEGINHAFPG